MLFPWTALAGWEARAIDTPYRRPFVIAEVDATRRRVRFKNSRGGQQWLYAQELEPIYQPPGITVRFAPSTCTRYWAREAIGAPRMRPPS